MMLYKFRNQTAFVCFIIGFIFVGLPVAYILDKHGIKLNDFHLFDIGLLSGVFVDFVYYLITKLYSRIKFLKLDKYWQKKENLNQIKSSEKYSIKHLIKGTKEFEEQFTKKMDYELALRDISKKEMMKDLDMNDIDWQTFMGQSLNKNK